MYSHLKTRNVCYFVQLFSVCAFQMVWNIYVSQQKQMFPEIAFRRFHILVSLLGHFLENGKVLSGFGLCSNFLNQYLRLSQVTIYHN